MRVNIEKALVAQQKIRGAVIRGGINPDFIFNQRGTLAAERNLQGLNLFDFDGNMLGAGINIAFQLGFFFLVSPRYIGVTTVSLWPSLPKQLLKESGSSVAIIPRPPHFIKVLVSAEIIQELILSISGQFFCPDIEFWKGFEFLEG